MHGKREAAFPRLCVCVCACVRARVCVCVCVCVLLRREKWFWNRRKGGEGEVRGLLQCLFSKWIWLKYTLQMLSALVLLECNKEHGTTFWALHSTSLQIIFSGFGRKGRNINTFANLKSKNFKMIEHWTWLISDDDELFRHTSYIQMTSKRPSGTESQSFEQRNTIYTIHIPVTVKCCLVRVIIVN